jgi:hypothetical protein
MMKTLKRKTSYRNAAQHVIPLGNGWAVKSAGSSGFIIITDKKTEAVSAGRTLARTKETELIVHDKDGKIRDTYSYKKMATKVVKRVR